MAQPNSIDDRSGDAAPRQAVVLIHGAGHFTQSDCDFVAGKLALRLGHPINLIGALYTDVPNSPLASPAESFRSEFLNEFVRDGLVRAMSSVPAQMLLGGITAAALPGAGSLLALMLRQLGSPDAPQFQAALATLQRVLPGIPVAPWLGQLAVPAAPGGVDVLCIVREVTYYLFDDDFRNAVQALVKPALESATSEYDDVIVVSHSLGTVVAFDILKACADLYPHISYWFTLGCPLAKLARVNSVISDLGKITETAIKHWHNIYDTTDLIANALGPTISKPNSPIHDIFVDVGTDPNTSHDYLHNDETFDLIAQVMW